MKDQTRNIEIFKVGSTRVNEFDFHKHQGEMREARIDDQDQPSNARQSRAERVAEITKKAHEKVLRRKKRQE
jgi:hypothetical protein